MTEEQITAKIRRFEDKAKKASSQALFETAERYVVEPLICCKELQRRGEKIPFDPDVFEAWLIDAADEPKQ